MANGVILQESGDIVVIATGLKQSSSNTKTGGMIQVYILHRRIHPIEASRTGADSAICGNCPHRGEITESGIKNRRCYVQLHNAPSSIYRAYQRGGYRKVDINTMRDLFRGRIARLGAYGDPAFMRADIVRTICEAAAGWTGYTHQWQRKPSLQRYLMASCDTTEEALTAQKKGWRTFRISRYMDNSKLSREISCPASAEAGKKTTRERCRLCNGSTPGDNRKSIVIQDHSVIKHKLIQIS